MSNYQALYDELQRPDYSGKTDEEIRDALRNQDIEYHVPVSSVDVATHLMETLSHHSTEDAPLTLYNILSLTYRDPQFSDAVRAYAENAIDLGAGVERMLDLHGNEKYRIMVNGLVGAERWNQSEADALLNLGRRYRSWGEELGFESIEQADLARARLWPDEDALNDLLLHNAAKANSIAGSLGLLLEQIRAGEAVEVPSLEDLATQYGATE